VTAHWSYAGSTRHLWVAAATAGTIGVVLLGAPGLAPRPAPDRPHPVAHATPGVPETAGSGGAAIPQPSSTPSSVPSALPSASPSPSAAALPTPTGPPWDPVATGFARDFTRPGAGHPDWLARVSRWTSDYLAGQYQHTDSHRIPVATLHRITPVTISETIVDFLAFYDTGLRLAGRVELGPAGWQVTSAQPAVETGK